MKTLSRSFYARDTISVAKDLLGKVLHYRSACSRTESGGVRSLRSRSPKSIILQGRINETEAYLQDDEACHASRGMTERNAQMFGEAGHAYVYLIYGVYHCLNAVTRSEGVGEAVLIRGVEPLKGVEVMGKNRGREDHIADGPGKLCQAFGIDKSLNGFDLTKGPLKIFDDGFEVGKVEKSKRVGITLNADKEWRFYY